MAKRRVNLPTHKVCKVCHQDLPITEYTPNSYYVRKDGKTSTVYCTRCRRCNSKYVYENYRRNHPIQPRKTREYTLTGMGLPEGTCCRSCGKMLNDKDRQRVEYTYFTKTGEKHYAYSRQCYTCYQEYNHKKYLEYKSKRERKE